MPLSQERERERERKARKHLQPTRKDNWPEHLEGLQLLLLLPPL